MLFPCHILSSIHFQVTNIHFIFSYILSWIYAMQVIIIGEKKRMVPVYQLVGWFFFVPQNDIKWVTVAHILAINCPIWNIIARK